MNRRLAVAADLRVGQDAAVTKTIGAADIEAFARLTGDVIPLHVDADFARRTFFGGRIAHGLPTAAALSTIVGMHLPGTGAIYRRQALEFLRPVRTGDTLTARGRVSEVLPEGIRVDCRVDNQRGERVFAGEAGIGFIRALRGETA